MTRTLNSILNSDIVQCAWFFGTLFAIPAGFVAFMLWPGLV